MVVDRGVITSRGPGTALDFALALVEILGGPDAAPVDRVAPRARKGRRRVTEAVDKARPETVREDEHASIVQSLARVDWLVLLVVALYALMLRAPEESSRLLYAAIAVYTLFVVAFRWRGFPVRETGSRIALGAAAMVAFITVVAMRTGGSASPMANLYLLPIVVVAMTLGRRGAIVVFAGVMLAWLSLVAGEGLRLPAGELLTRLFGELGPWALVAYVTQALAGTILTARRRIEEMAERDSLTGMLNLRTFKAMLGREHGLRARDGRGELCDPAGGHGRPEGAQRRARAPGGQSRDHRGRKRDPARDPEHRHGRALRRRRVRDLPAGGDAGDRGDRSRSASATTSIAACFRWASGCSA